MNSRPNCQARVVGDEYHCYKCGLVWDISDLDPPECKTVFNVGTSRTKPFKDEKIIIESNPSSSSGHDEEISKMREIFKND